uniref:Putative secreted protein n=1 Tax=Lutzomyia longipalpis TaxID=7200 RepID=A0A7G3ANG5_LUTLO
MSLSSWALFLTYASTMDWSFRLSSLRPFACLLLLGRFSKAYLSDHKNHTAAQILCLRASPPGYYFLHRPPLLPGLFALMDAAPEYIFGPLGGPAAPI